MTIKKNEKCIKDNINKSNIDNENNKKDINHINDNINDLSIKNNKKYGNLFMKKAAKLIEKKLTSIDILLLLEDKIDHKILFNFINKLHIDTKITKKYLERNFKNKISNMKGYFLNFKIEGDRVKEVKSSDNLYHKNLLCLKVTDKFEIPGFIFENLSLFNFMKLLNHLSPRITLITHERSIFSYGNEFLINILDRKCFRDTDKDGV